MKYFVFIIAFSLCLVSVFAQNRITVQNGNQTTFYTNLDSAIINSPSGATILIPGGNWSISGATTQIDKKLYIYGVGHYPDSTKATGRTQISGDVCFISGADSSVISGIYISGSLRFGTSSANQKIKYLTISRCNIKDSLKLGFEGNTEAQNNLISECVLNTIIGFNQQNTVFDKNIINDNIRYFDNCKFNNNIFLKKRHDGNGLENRILVYINNCIFTDNVFLQESYYGFDCIVNHDGVSSFNNTFYNNLLTQNTTFPLPGNNVGFDNIVNVAQSDIFENQTGSAFDYKHDYHLRSDCPGKNAGLNGYDIGLYGTNVPYKEGAVPLVPHFIKADLAPEATANGMLKVTIEVEAQKR